MRMKEIKQFCHASIINPVGGHAMIFPITKGCEFEEMDVVALNTKTCQVSHPEQSGNYFAVGRAVRTVTSESGSKMLLCRDGIFMFNNTVDDLEHKITKDDIGKDCYIESECFVSMNSNQRTKAGKVVQAYEDSVIVEIDIYEGEE